MVSDCIKKKYYLEFIALSPCIKFVQTFEWTKLPDENLCKAEVAHILIPYNVIGNLCELTVFRDWK